MAASKGTLDAWCPDCKEVRKFDLMDPGSCKCTVCGHVEQMLRPMKPGEQVSGPPSKPKPATPKA